MQPDRPVREGDTVTVRGTVVRHDPGVGVLVDLVLTTGRYGAWVREDQIHEHIPPPVPDEPEPGAYLIGDRLAVRFETEAGQLWHTANDDQSWTQLWAEIGGPDATIRRLVPEPEPVALPWETQPYAPGVNRAVVGAWTRGGTVRAGVTIGHRENGIDLDPDTAEAMAAALWTAARAARTRAVTEETP
jgi:hypothetical protein